MIRSAVVVSIVFASGVSAQYPVGNLRSGPIYTVNGGAAGMLRYKSVQTELKLNDEQVKKAEQILQTVAKNQHARFREAQKLKGAKASPDDGQNTAETAAEGRALAKEILSPAQFTRLLQLERQFIGPTALFHEDVQQALSLSEDQMKTIRDIFLKLGRAESELFRAGSGASKEQLDRREADLEQTALKDMLAVLSAEQRNTWSTLIGKSLDVKSIELLRSGPAGQNR